MDELEIKVWRLADRQEDEDVCTQGVPAPQQPTTCQAEKLVTNSSLQSIEDLTGMGFDSPNYSPIPPVRNTAPQWPRGSVLTSTPIPNGGLGLNISDLTHNKGKASIVDSLANSEEIQKKSSKGGKVKSSQGAQPKNKPQLSTSSQATSNTCRPLVHCSACGDHLHKDCHRDTFCTKCRPRSHNTEMCCAPTKNRKREQHLHLLWQQKPLFRKVHKQTK